MENDRPETRRNPRVLSRFTLTAIAYGCCNGVRHAETVWFVYDLSVRRKAQRPRWPQMHGEGQGAGR